MKKKNWYPLDNAAKIFPSTSNKNRPNMFSVSVELVEDINKDILQETINVVLERFPTYKVKLKKGLFWNYLEENKAEYLVEELDANMYDYYWLRRKRGYLFNLTYYKNRIWLVVFHVLTDGTGAMELLKTIVYQYLKFTGKQIEGEGLITNPDAPSVNAETLDNFQKYYDKNKSTPPKQPKAYHLEGTHFEYGGVGIIVGTLSVSALKKITKRYNVTITTYLCALFTYVIYLNHYKPDRPIKKPVSVLVPTNMRKIFNDETTRNFAGFVRLISYLGPDITFEEILADYDKQMKEKVTKEYLTHVNNANVKFEKNFILRITPLFIKNIVLKIGYSILADSIQTSSMSNLGVINLPKSMSPYVTNVFFDLSASYNGVKNVGICSYLDKLNISFSRSIIETGIEQKFFNFLAQQGLDVEIISNYWEK